MTRPEAPAAASPARRGRERRSRGPLLAALAVVVLAATGAAPSSLTDETPASQSAKRLQAVLAQPQYEDLRRAYAARRHEPVWIADGRLGPHAADLVRLIGTAAEDGLDPKHYQPQRLAALSAAAETREPAALAEAEAALSLALVGYVGDLRTPLAEARPVVTDAAAPLPASGPAAILEEAADLVGAGRPLDELRRMHPLYEGLRRALAAHRAAGGGETRERLILANLDRARVLPADPGRRYILVDVAAATLTLYENGAPTEAMKVAVGSTRHATPAMVGAVRYLAFNPYWNVPPDLARHTYAPQALRHGPDRLEALGMEALSDWTPQAAVIPASEIDWAQVAAGERRLRLRQRPGPGNVMGKVKFMMPNRLGIYLHDTPDKSVFGRARRLVSSGCVRLSDADALARRLLGRPPPALDAGAGEVRVNLPEPVPVYILYFTAAPGDSGLRTRPDVYGRDPQLLAAMASTDRA